MVLLRDDTRKLFGEQVNDHIEKLNDLMSLAAGAPFDEQAIRKAALATRLLEGSTRMLGFEVWSRTLKSLRELMERCASSKGAWNEQLSQIVSEVLETEEQLAAEIISGEIEEAERPERFAGLEQEIECLSKEPLESPQREEGLSLASEPLSRKKVSPDTSAILGRTPVFERLIESLGRVKDLFEELMDQPASEKIASDIETAFGESQFLMHVASESLNRLGKGQRSFRAKISSGAVIEGLKEFFSNQLRIRHWNAHLAAHGSEFTLDIDMACSLSSILSSCIFDICKRYEMRDDVNLSVGVDIHAEGSHVVVKVEDNGPDLLSDSEIDRDDAGAFYQCLREIRPHLERAGSILWLEPKGKEECRFMFTLPRSQRRTDYCIVCASGRRLAIPRHAVETIVPLESVEISRSEGWRAVRIGSNSVPVYALEELVTDEIEPAHQPDRILVCGIAERRIGLLVDGQARIVEALREQVTEGSWQNITNGVLNVGSDEYPIVDVKLVLRSASAILGVEGGPVDAGSYVETGCRMGREEAVPRA